MIPLALYQTDRTVPSREYLREWRSASPGLQYVFHDDCTGHEYLRLAWSGRHAAAFRSLVAGGIKSDFLRLCYIADRGGFYADTDALAGNVSLLELSRDSGSSLIVTASVDVEEERAPEGFVIGRRPRMFNSFFGARPRHPLLLELVRKALGNIESRFASDVRSRAGRDYHDVMGIAGPTLLGPLVHEPSALVLYEWPRGKVYHYGWHRNVCRSSGSNYKNGKPWWLHWRHIADQKSVYHPANLTRPPLKGADRRPCCFHSHRGREHGRVLKERVARQHGSREQHDIRKREDEAAGGTSRLTSRDRGAGSGEQHGARERSGARHAHASLREATGPKKEGTQQCSRAPVVPE